MTLLLAAAWPGLSRQAWRRHGLAAGAWITAVVMASAPAWTPAPQMVAVEQDGCVIQSSNASCGAGATANLLRQHGIAADEHGMADLCLTGTDGTWFHGLVRGLRCKCAGTR